MRLARPRSGATRRLMLSFVLLLLLPAVAVVWLGMQLLAQDRELEARQSRERAETAADRATTALEQALTVTERQLRDLPRTIPVRSGDDAVVLILGQDRLEARPRQHLLYSPVVAAGDSIPPGVFDAGEAYEHRFSNFTAAAEAFRRLAQSPNDDVRAGALLRLARNLRRLDRHDEALRVYETLATLTGARVLGLPADLVARRATCALLYERHHKDAARQCADRLMTDLVAARWTIDRGTFDTYVLQTETWLERPAPSLADRRGLAAAAEWLLQQRADKSLGSAGRTLLYVDRTPIVILWHSHDDSVVALAGGPRFQQREWLGVLAADAVARGFVVAASDGERGAVQALARRPASQTGLPWTIVVSDNGSPTMSDDFARRRRMLLAGLSLLLVLVIAGGYSVGRAVSREVAVARLQTDFVAAVSHEFRTPLTSLHQFTALLNDAEEPPPAKRRMFYQAQARASERLRRLVESLLDFGRMEAGARPYQLAALDVSVLVRNLTDDFHREVEMQGFTVDCTIDGHAAIVNADADALGRAVWNLLDNAVKYSGNSRHIAVDVDTTDGRVEISVRDKGLGIPRHEQAEIFEKFVRGAASREHGIKGTGIGLAMVRHIVQAHGGSVRVHSAPGEGSSFTIALPRVVTG